MENACNQQQDAQGKNDQLRSAFMADKKLLQDKIDDLERKLTNRLKNE